MAMRRTDLALEARELWQESAGETTKLPGVEARDGEREGLPVTTVDILDREDRELRGEGQEPGEGSTQAEADGDMEQEEAELTEDDGQQEMEAA